MSISVFENDLKLVLSHVEEFEQTEYGVSLAVGSQSETGSVRFAVFATRDPNKLSELLTAKAWYGLPHVFQEANGALPTTVVFFHVRNLPKEMVAEVLMRKFQEAATLPSPTSTDDVEFHVLQSDAISK